MGWLTDLTNWLKEQILAFWTAISDFFGDMLVKLVSTVLDLFARGVEAIGVPDFMTTYSLDGLLGSAGPTIVWVAQTFRLGECLGIIAAGVAFRLMRKLLTLGQW